MTVYNGEKYLSQAIKSIQNQTLRDIELVIVDDGSTDDTSKILTEAGQDPRVRVILSQRLGRAKALNLAWRNTTGKYVANFDADDLADPPRLQAELTYMKEHPNVGLLGTAWKVIPDDLDDEAHWHFVQPPTTHDELKKALLRYNPFNHSSVMMRRDVLEALNGYNEEYEVAIDYEMWARIAQHYEVANLEEILITQRIHSHAFFQSGSIIRKYFAVVKCRWITWANENRSIFDLLYVVSPISEMKEWIMSTYRRLQRNWMPQGLPKT